MSDNQLSPDDPLLTAYALGELDPSEQERIERLVSDSPAAQTAVREIRELGGLLTVELRGEAQPALTEAQRGAILEPVGQLPSVPATPTTTASVAAPPASRRGRWLAGLTALAATVGVAAVVIPPPNRNRQPPELAGTVRLTDDSALMGDASRWNLAFHDGAVAFEGLAQQNEADPFRFTQKSQQPLAESLETFGEKNGNFGGNLARSSGTGLALDGVSNTTTIANGNVPSSGAGQGGQYFPYAGNNGESREGESIASGKGQPAAPFRRRETRRKATAGSARDESGPVRDRILATDDYGAVESKPTLEIHAPVTAGKQSGGRGSGGGSGGGRGGMKPEIDALRAKSGYAIEPSTAPEGQVTHLRTNVAGAGDLDAATDSPDAGNKPRGRPDASRFSTVARPAKRPASGKELDKLSEAERAERKAIPEVTTTFEGQFLMRQTPGKESSDSKGKRSSEAQDQALAPLVESFNESVNQKLFDAADKIAREAKQQAPDSQVADLMLYKAKLAKTVTEERRARESLLVTDIEYPDLKKWRELTESRHRLAEQNAPGTEACEPIVENSFLSAYESPLSTFGIDVDTASYANMRRFLTQQQLPPPNAVRIEELVNYFAYDYPQPVGAEPFSVSVDSGPAPWQPRHKLVRIGLKGKVIPREQRPASNLVFLVDVSGSMQPENKLPLVKMGLRLLTQQMTESDRVAIVTYSDSAVQRLESTNGTNKQAILGVIESLQAGGSTNGAAGIQLAYRAAIDHFIEGGTNRVILCTDGDFNVGVTGDDQLVQLIQERARTKVFFSVFGFGMGNLKDGKLEKLADKGNGNYAYIDGQREAQKVFVDELVGTLVTIAKDVKIQVEFNPNQVGFYRLIGYENRMLSAHDFADDRKDAGDIGAGHTVTALYEIAPAADAPKPELGDALRYRKAVVPQEGALSRELLTVKLRYKLPEADASTLVEVPIPGDARDAASETKGLAGAPVVVQRDFNWAAAVAAFGMLLRDSQFRGQTSFDMILELAQGAKGDDPTGRRQEFIDLVRATKALCVPTEAVLTQPASDPAPALSREEAEAKAAVNGKYRNLLRIVESPADSTSYGSFYDYGHWEGTSYAGQNNIPQGYWVYVAPNWFIWGDVK